MSGYGGFVRGKLVPSGTTVAEGGSRHRSTNNTAVSFHAPLTSERLE